MSIILTVLSLALLPPADNKAAKCSVDIDKSISRIADIPIDIKTDLLKRVKNIADFGSRFNETDEIDPKLPFYRFVGAWKIKNAWIISYEHGGMKHVHNIGYFKIDGKNNSYAIDYTANLVGERCWSAKALTSGVRSAFQNHF